MKEVQTYLSAGDVRQRYGVSDMSLWRWLRDELWVFPVLCESMADGSGRVPNLKRGNILTIRR